MANRTYPPQAYTREMLVEAFNWLQDQPDHVREAATTPEALVGLFTRAKRYGPSSGVAETDAPVSSKVFKNDLKTLAEGFKPFEREAATPIPPAPSAKNINSNHLFNQTQGPIGQEPMQNMPSTRITPEPSVPPPPQPPPQKVSSPLGDSRGFMGLDSQSVQAIRDTMLTLNLSSETEALRALIALGAKTLKSTLE